MDPLNLTEKEKNAPAGMSTIDGGAMSGYNPAPSTPPALDPQSIANINNFNANLAAPTPAAAPGASSSSAFGVNTSAGFETPDQTVSRIQDILSGVDNEGGEFIAPTYYEEPEMPEQMSDEEIRRASIRNQRRLFQGEIDATNQVYDQLLREARMEGQGRIGSQRAMAARGGLLGSDFAGAQKDRVQSYNTDINRGIQAERRAAIGAIEGTMRAAVQEEEKLKREARQAGADAWLDNLANKTARRENYRDLLVQDLLAQGVSIEDLTEEELAQYLRPAGLKADDVKATYLRAKANAEAEGGDFGFMSTTGGIFRTDPRTGESVFIPAGGAQTPTGGGTTSSSSSTVTGGVPINAEDEAPEGFVVERIDGQLYYFPDQKVEKSFEDFIQEKQNEQQMSFTPETRESYRDEYNELYGAKIKSNQAPLKNLTSSKKQSLEQSGLLNAPGDVQTFFLNTPNDFQSFYSRGVALGNFGSDISAAELETIMNAYEEEEDSGSGRSI